MVGNITNYNRMDTLRCFLSIEGRISREHLAKAMGLGEGSMRAILKNLKGKKLIESTKKGHFLTKEGKHLQERLNNRIKIKRDVENNFYRNSKNTALLLKTEKDIKFDIFQRDIAVKNGADSCLIFKYKNKKLSLPLFRLGTGFSSLEKEFDFGSNSLLVITFSENRRVSENSALAVGSEIDKGFRSLISPIII